MTRHWPTNYPFRRVEEHGGKVVTTPEGFRLEPQAGDFQFRDENQQATNDREKVEYFEFYCPVRGTYCGLIRCANLVKPAKVPSWALVPPKMLPESTPEAPLADPASIDLDKPTLTPSINCTGGCGWHGFVRDGEFVKA